MRRMPTYRSHRLLAGALAVLFVALPVGGAAFGADHVPVRAATHPGYGRIVFDWPATVGYSATIDGRKLTLHFDRPLESSFGTVLKALATYVRSMSVNVDGRTVVATLKKDYRLRTFRAESRVVVDLMDSAGVGATPRSEPARAATAGAASAVPPRVAVRAGRASHYGRLVFAWPTKVPFTVDRDGGEVTLRFASPGRIDLAQLRRSLPPQIGAVSAHSDAKSLEIHLTVVAGAQLRYFHNGSDVVFDVVAPVMANAGEKPPRRLGPAGLADATRKSVASGPLVSVDASRDGGEAILRFNWREPVHAAVFRREGALWVTFDRPARLDVGPIRVTGKGLFEKVEQEPIEGGSAVRLTMTMPYDVAVRREGTIWTVEAGPARKDKGTRIRPRLVRDDAGARLVLPVRDPGPVAVLTDPAVGDSLFVIPLSQPAVGLYTARHFAEFELLDSAEGIAVRPLDERVRVTRDAAGITIWRPGGLTISDAARIAKAGGPRSKSHLLNLTAWLYGPPEEFERIENELLQYIVQPGGTRRSAARIGLARFYVAHGFGPEALGVIGVAAHDDPTIVNDPSLRALRGAASYLTGHYTEAAADFGDPLLNDIKELDPWRAGIAAARGDWEGAYRLFDGTDRIFAQYPAPFAISFGLLATEAALSVNDLDTAGVRLSVLEALPATPSQLDYIAYLKGHLLKRRNETDKAIALWQSVIAMGDRRSRAKASFALVDTLYDRKRISLADAIERLSQLRFAWRDDVFEFDLLHRLGELYAANKDIRDALLTLRQAVKYFRGIKGAQSLTKEMRALFRNFYLSGDAEKVAPVVAVALFDEFRNLTPDGAEGDRLIGGLVKRLVSVDLLSDAADLLGHLVRDRLQGAAKAKAGARLVKILLADRKPEKALDALKASKIADKEMGPSLVSQRHYLKARVLAAAGRISEAMRLLDRDYSTEADTLRAQIFWRAADWHDASLALARLTAGFGGKKLDDLQADLLLRRAVALALAGNRKGIGFLRERFGSAMAKTPRAAAFLAVIGRPPKKAEDFAELARQAADLDIFSDFMKKLQKNPIGVPAEGGGRRPQSADASS